jgi:hypothetical protein
MMVIAVEPGVAKEHRQGGDRTSSLASGGH